MDNTQDNVNEGSGLKPMKLLDRVREIMRLKHYSIRTEEAYIDCMVRFICFHNMRHPKDMGPPEIEAFLTHPASKANVAASIQNQAFHAILFLYRQVLDIPLEGEPINALRARKKKNLPVVLTKEEVRRVITLIPGKYQLMAKIMYGGGLRLMECIRLRVKDSDFEMNEITVRDGKGGKDRLTTLAESVKPALKGHLERVRLLHEQDLAAGHGSVYLLHALERKYLNADLLEIGFRSQHGERSGGDEKHCLGHVARPAADSSPLPFFDLRAFCHFDRREKSF